MDPATHRMRVDGPVLSRATAELHYALISQNFAFSQNFERGIWSSGAQKKLRNFSLFLCAIGEALSIYMYVSVRPGCPAATLAIVFMASFAALAMVFYRVFEIQATLQTWSRGFAGRRLKKHADKTVAPIAQQSPMEIEYTMSAERVRADWIRDGEPCRSWERPLLRSAFVGDTVVAFFKKPNAFYPKVVVLHDDRERMIAALESLGVELIFPEKEIPVDYGLAAAPA